MEKQAVVEPTEGQPAEKDAQQPGAEVADAQDVEALLKEFDDSTPDQTKVEPKAEKLSADEVREAVEFVRTQKSQDAVNEVVKLAKPVFDEINLPDRARRVLLEDYATGNQPFLNAFANRHRNPEGFAKIVRAAAKSIAADFSPADPSATADVDAITSAVRASQTPAPKADKEFEQQVRTMSDAEFRRLKQTMGGF